MESTEMLSIARDIALGLSAIAVAFLAWLGLRTWKKELTGKAKFETARNMMRLGFELKDSFEWVRHPLSMSNEWADRPIGNQELPNESEVLSEWHVKNKRLKHVVENLNKIIEVQWEIEILFNKSSVKSIKEAVQSYRESYGDLSSALYSFFDIRQDEVRTGQPYRDQEWIRDLHKKLYSATDDDFSKKVNNATDNLSTALKMYVK